jgi:hypothetical protein
MDGTILCYYGEGQKTEENLPLKRNIQRGAKTTKKLPLKENVLKAKRKGLLRLQHRNLENKEEKQIKNLPKLPAITFVHFLCLSLFSPFF